MSELTTLTEKLSALVAEDEVFVAGARVITDESGEVAMAAVLREIDSTVLERTLIFTIGEVDVAAVVSGRRLRGIYDIAGDAPGRDKVAGQVLSQEDPTTLKATGALLMSLCGAADRVSVRSRPMDSFGTSADAGITAAGLADIWDIDPHATPPPPVIRFMTANVASLIAYMYHHEGAAATETAGETAPLEAVWKDQIKDYRKRQRELNGKKAAGPHLTCLEGPFGPGTALAIAMTGEEVCLCTFSPDQMGALAASWQAITG